MRIYRSRVQDILFEFAVPKKAPNGIIILCEGLPSVPKRKELMIDLVDKNFIVVFPRYKGTWESSGEFLKESPAKDIKEVLQKLKQGQLTELYANKQILLSNLPIHLLGSSFGASVTLALAGDSHISKIVALSPIVDFKKHNKEGEEEDLAWVGKFIKRAFGEGYRFKSEQWDKMTRGKLFNPLQDMNQKVADTILIGYGRLDPQIDYKKIKQYITDNNIKQVIDESSSGHLTFSGLSDKIWDKIITWLLEK